MAMSKFCTTTRQMFSHLQTGVDSLVQFMKDLRNAYDETKCVASFIKRNLLPTVNKANTDLKEMIKQASELVKEYNLEVERNINKLKIRNDEVNELQTKLNQLWREKTGAENNLYYAENHVRAKKNDLHLAKQALEAATTKLNAAKEERRKAQLAASIMWAIPIVGWIGASIATIVDCTALKQGVETSEAGVQSAQDEYSNSKDALTRAKNQVFEVNQKISCLEYNRNNKESKLKNLNSIVKNLRECQRIYTSLNEDAKNLDHVLVLFYGKVEVLASETDGGYSIDVLRLPAVEVIKALSKLMQSDIIKSVGGTATNDIWKHVIEMEAIKWPSVGYLEDH